MKRFASAAIAALLFANAAPALAQEATTEEAPASSGVYTYYTAMRLTATIAGEMNRSSSLEVSCNRLQRDNDRWQRNARGQMLGNMAYATIHPPYSLILVQEDLGRFQDHRNAVLACEKLFPTQPLY